MFVPAMWITWGTLVTITLVLSVFRSRLERDEEDLLFLGDSLPQEKAQQAEIVAKVNRMQPIMRVSISATALMSAFVILYYLRDIYVQLFGK